MPRLDEQALNQLFLSARSAQTFFPEPVSDRTLQELYELVRQGPTGFNAQPARLLFLRSAEAKARLAPALSNANRDKTLAAPVNVIIAWDARFHDQLPEQFPGFDAKGFFDNKPELIAPTAVTNATLQAGYLIIAARSLGLDIGPMSGFDTAKVDAEFFPGSHWRSLLLANLGYADPATFKPANPRLPFDTTVKIL